MDAGIDVRSRQDPLRKHYRESPEDARITDRAKTSGGTGMDPFRGVSDPALGSPDNVESGCFFRNCLRVAGPNPAYLRP
jgi:hypothetical protein